MPTRESVLEELTYLDEETVSGRIFRSLHTPNDNDFSKIKTIKLLGELISILRQKDLITDDEIDDMLLESVQ
ncbi:MAG: hypothetical protein PHY09_02160 [Desulfuromonadaceae bacterium]|nr:hypothetical protein [Desulfuromonadaceae bacterium]MDD2850686.1 hypothetical protein [Desulfuromonadaceae bacterium]MDD5105596.1 hypothetical protein [Desulfuromonadaceae bacterium]MDD5105600.1 hypothetical protein [Desulfuromonadaceae bacterium]